MTCAKGKFLQTARYVVIGKEGAECLNLAEVTASDSSLDNIVPESTALSTAISQDYSSDKCIDKKIETYCSTHDGHIDPFPTLTIDYGDATSVGGVDISDIVVLNRQDCCKVKSSCPWLCPSRPAQ